jgi:hypothetical protein
MKELKKKFVPPKLLVYNSSYTQVIITYKIKNSVVLVREQTVPTE